MTAFVEILHKLDKKSKKVKDIPITHYEIDLRFMSLVQKIAKHTPSYKKFWNRYQCFKLGNEDQGFSEA